MSQLVVAHPQAEALMIRHVALGLFVSFFVSFSAMAQDAKLIAAAKKERSEEHTSELQSPQ